MPKRNARTVRRDVLISGHIETYMADPNRLRTPLSAQLLNRLVSEYSWNQQHLASKSGLKRSTVAMHLSATRPIRDLHVGPYLSAVKRVDVLPFVSAWLRDMAGEYLPELNTRAGAEAIVGWRPSLTPNDRSMMNWLAGQMILDPDLAKLVRSICKRLGYEGP